MNPKDKIDESKYLIDSITNKLAILAVFILPFIIMAVIIAVVWTISFQPDTITVNKQDNLLIRCDGKRYLVNNFTYDGYKFYFYDSQGKFHKCGVYRVDEISALSKYDYEK